MTLPNRSGYTVNRKPVVSTIPSNTSATPNQGSSYGMAHPNMNAPTHDPHHQVSVYNSPYLSHGQHPDLSHPSFDRNMGFLSPDGNMDAAHHSSPNEGTNLPFGSGASFFNSTKIGEMFKGMPVAPQETLTVEELHERKSFIRAHRLLPAIMEMLTSCKKEGILPEPPSVEAPHPLTQDFGLEDFLESQGIDTSPVTAEDSQRNPQREEFLFKLEQLRFKYKEEIEKLNKVQNECISQLIFVLREHSLLRPVGEAEAQSKLQKVKQKFDYVKNQLRVCVCDAIAALQKQYNQTRKKHKSLPKKASQSLSAWFFEHINNPYPTEQEKSMLAAAGNLTLVQVNNWFGNKRIRYKRKCLETEAKQISDAITVGGGGGESEPPMNPLVHGHSSLDPRDPSNSNSQSVRKSARVKRSKLNLQEIEEEADEEDEEDDE